MSDTTPLSIVYLSVNSLIPWPRNAKRHGDANLEFLAGSLEEFDFWSPILVQKGTHKIVAGNGRWMAAKKLGREEIPCVVRELTDDEADKINLADNRLAELSPWDEVARRNILREISEEGYDVRLIGYTEDEVQRLLSEEPAELPEDPDATELPGESQDNTAPRQETLENDMITMGRHKLYCADPANSGILETLPEGAHVCAVLIRQGDRKILLGGLLQKAEKAGWTCILVEPSPKRCDNIVQKWEETTGEKAERTQIEPEERLL